MTDTIDQLAEAEAQCATLRLALIAAGHALDKAGARLHPHNAAYAHDAEHAAETADRIAHEGVVGARLAARLRTAERVAEIARNGCCRPGPAGYMEALAAYDKER